MERMSLNKPKVSIIVPIYNVEKFIEKCACSLLEQTYENIEYIFVNDASTDDSWSILNKLIKKYEDRDIKLLCNRENKGSSFTRNFGLQNSVGEYTTFCDSDDWIERDAIEIMVSTAIGSGCDVVVAPFYVNTFGKETILNFKEKDVYNLNKIAIDYLHFSLCNKLIRSSWLKENYLFSIPSVDCWEDLSVIARLYALEPKVELLNRPFYHYRKYEYHSLTSDSHERQLNDRMYYADFLTKWFEERKIEQKYSIFLNHLQFMAKIKMLRTKPRQFRRWKSTYPASNNYILQYSDIPIYYRILFCIVNKLIKS